jgi:formyltetrahydrofolate deformylase
VIGNHDELRGVVESHGIACHQVPVPKEEAGKRAAAFEQIENLFVDAHGDVMVLARFMQIVPPEMTARWRPVHTGRTSTMRACRYEVLALHAADACLET